MLNARKILIYLSVIYDGDWQKIYDCISRREEIKATNEEMENVISTVKANALTILDDNYPDCLKQFSNPPFVIYYYGDISLIKDYKKNISVVGSREATSYGTNITKEIVSVVAKKYCIVSGLARGIDAIAHQSAIDSGGKTIAILGSGIDVCYPQENLILYNKIKKDHLLISEYPNSVSPNPSYFPSRNRLIAALGRATLVTEAKLKSGTMITVSFAIEYGREVLCVPNCANIESGCNHLIREGATLVENGNDVMEELESKWDEKK